MTKTPNRSTVLYKSQEWWSRKRLSHAQGLHTPSHYSPKCCNKHSLAHATQQPLCSSHPAALGLRPPLHVSSENVASLAFHSKTWLRRCFAIPSVGVFWQLCRKHQPIFQRVKDGDFPTTFLPVHRIWLSSWPRVCLSPHGRWAHMVSFLLLLLLLCREASPAGRQEGVCSFSARNWWGKTGAWRGGLSQWGQWDLPGATTQGTAVLSLKWEGTGPRNVPQLKTQHLHKKILKQNDFQAQHSAPEILLQPHAPGT